MKKFLLSDKQAEILRHRLEVPDAMFDTYEQTDGTYQMSGYTITLEQIEEACDAIMASLDRDKCLPANPDELTIEVITNAVELSTYYGCHCDCGLHPLKVAGILRSGEALAKQVTSYIKHYYPDFEGELVYPNW